MRLADVDAEEVHAVAVALRELLERPNLGAEGRSGVRAEDQRDRTFLDERAQAGGVLASEQRQLEVRCEVALGHLRRQRSR